MTLGQRLKALRRSKGFTQAQLGASFGLAESTISLYEADKRAPDYTILKGLAAFFQVSLDYLLNNSAQKQPAPFIMENSPCYGSVPIVPQLLPDYPVLSESALKSGSIGLQKMPHLFWFKVKELLLSEEGILPDDLVLINRTPPSPGRELNLAIVQVNPSLPQRLFWIRDRLLLSEEGNPYQIPDDGVFSQFTIIGQAKELHRIYKGAR